MSGLEFLFRRTISNSSELQKAHSPKDFKGALDELVDYCEKQLPQIVEIDFIPICFSITKDGRSIALGGHHGNIGLYEPITKKLIKDEEVCRSAVKCMLLVANDTQLVVLNETFELTFLEFPSFENIHQISLRAHPVTIRLREERNILYVSNHLDEILSVTIDISEEEVKNYPEEKIKMPGVVKTFDLSEDGSLLVIAVENGVFKLIFPDTGYELHSSPEHSSEISILAFSQNRRELAVAYCNNEVQVWKIDSNIVLLKTITEHTNEITGLSFVRDDRYLISGSKDNKLIITDLKVERKPYPVVLYDHEVLWLKTSHDHKKLYFAQKLPSFMIWDVPLLSKNVRHCRHSEDVNRIVFLSNSFDLFTIGSDGLLVVYDYRGDNIVDTIQLEGSLTNVVVAKSGKFAAIASNKPYLYIMTNLNSSFNIEPKNIPGEIIALKISDNEELIAMSDTMSRIIIMDMKNTGGKRFTTIKGHLEPVTEIYFLEQDTMLLTSSLDGTLGKWEIATGNRLLTFVGHQDSVTCMIITLTGWVISASNDNTVIIWNLQGLLLYTITLNPDWGLIKSLYLSDDNMHLITLQEHFVTFWQMYNLSVIFQLNTKYIGNCMALSQDEKIIAIGDGNTLYLEENPLRSQSPKIVGRDEGSAHKFMKFIGDTIKYNTKSPYNSDQFNHWVYTPYLIGVTHILAYANRVADLNSALFNSKTQAPFFSTINNENPLSICTDLAYKNCIDICLKYLKYDYKRNTRAYVPIESCLTKLNTVELPGITKIYETLFQKSSSAHLPSFCLHETELPALYHSEQLIVFPENIVPADFFSSSGRSVEFFQSLCPLDTDTGTNGSIEFLTSLTECSNDQIFRCKMLQVLLLNKWDRVKWAVYGQGMLYILYMILLSLFCIFFRESPGFLVLLFICHIFLFLYEVTQIATDFFDYWGDMWNILDQLRGFTCTIYTILVWRGDDNTNVLLAVVIFSWTRGISYFRMFDGTRYMVRLLAEVIKDMREFFVVLFYSTIAFSFILFVRNPEITFFEYLGVSYRLDLGDWDAEYTSVFDWIIFFLATVINPLIMLNLLISIMGDTYGKVQESNDIANFQELTEMVIEIEKLMFWKKRLEHKHYLQQCDFKGHDEAGTDKITEKLKLLKSQITSVEGSMNEIKELVKENSNFEINAAVHCVKEEQDKMKNDINQALTQSSMLIEKISSKLQID